MVNGTPFKHNIIQMVQKSKKTRNNAFSPVKEYKAIHNLNLEDFFNINSTLAKSIYSNREDIDFPKGGTSNKEDLKNYTRKIIRESAPWEDFSNEAKVEIGPPTSYSGSLSTLNSGLNTISSELEHKKKQAQKGLWGSILAVITIVLFKAKGLIVLLLTKLWPLLIHTVTILAKFKGILLTAGSMVITILIYASYYKLELAIGLVFLIFVHEMGHALMITFKGIRAGLPVFIPFFGAFISIKDIPKDAVTEAQIAIGGPLLGTIAALVMYETYNFTGKTVWLYLAYVGFIINLFNLTPVSPLDGGRVVGAISKKMWLFGLVALILFTLIFKTPALIFILFFAIINLFHNQHKTEEAKTEYFNVPLLLRMLFGYIYFALAAFLGYACYLCHTLLKDSMPISP